MVPFYETERAVAEYLLFHYGSPELVMPWSEGPRQASDFPSRCVHSTVRREELPPHPRALDLGCAVGRVAFELSGFCQEVVGVDLSKRFIAAARRLQSDGTLTYPVTIEGSEVEQRVAHLPPAAAPARVRFEVGDALRLGPDLGTFDLVLAVNLLDRVARPAQLLQQFEALVRPGGQLVLVSPYTWLEEFTPRENWLCGQGQRTAERLASFLPAFEFLKRRDLPFVIREHSRKYQWSVADATTWRRRPDPA